MILNILYDCFIVAWNWHNVVCGIFCDSTYRYVGRIITCLTEKCPRMRVRGQLWLFVSILFTDLYFSIVYYYIHKVAKTSGFVDENALCFPIVRVMGANDPRDGTSFDPRGDLQDLCSTLHNNAAYK